MRSERGRVHCSTTQTQKKNTPCLQRYDTHNHNETLLPMLHAAASKQIQTERKSLVLQKLVAFSTAKAAQLVCFYTLHYVNYG